MAYVVYSLYNESSVVQVFPSQSYVCTNVISPVIRCLHNSCVSFPCPIHRKINSLAQLGQQEMRVGFWTNTYFPWARQWAGNILPIFNTNPTWSTISSAVTIYRYWDTKSLRRRVVMWTFNAKYTARMHSLRYSDEICTSCIVPSTYRTGK